MSPGKVKVQDSQVDFIRQGSQYIMPQSTLHQQYLEWSMIKWSKC